MGKYLVLYQIGGAGDPVIYRPGAVLNVPGDMDELSAELHTNAGNLRPVDGTPAPAVKPAAAIIHEAPAEDAKPAKPSKASKADGD